MRLSDPAGLGTDKEQKRERQGTDKGKTMTDKGKTGTNKEQTRDRQGTDTAQHHFSNGKPIFF